jgi:hypothetical protein
VRSAGVREDSILGAENRKKALATAYNWAVRFLIALAVESPPVPPKGERGLAWLQQTLRPLRRM